MTEPAEMVLICCRINHPQPTQYKTTLSIKPTAKYCRGRIEIIVAFRPLYLQNLCWGDLCCVMTFM